MLTYILENRNYLVSYLMIWLSIAAVHSAVLLWGFQLSVFTSVVDAVIFNLLYAVLGLGLMYPAKYFSPEKKSGFTVVANNLVVAAASAFIWANAGNFIVKNLFIDDSYNKFLVETFYGRILLGVLFYIVMVSVNYSRLYYQRFNEKLLRESELRAMVKEAELKKLKYQINPHFIFNSLNSISALTITNPERAREMTIKLSEFMRSTLRVNEKPQIPLSEELRNMKNYLEIEKIRFEDKLNFKENVSNECNEILVPNMILQPLVENAVKHGVYESTEIVNINLRCELKGNFLTLSISNNFDPDSPRRKGEGIGLQNTERRLYLFYGQHNLLEFSAEGSIFTVNVYIPIQQNEDKTSNKNTTN